jgi:hypothetical protein
VTRNTRDPIDPMAREHADEASKTLAALDTTVASVLPGPSAAAADDGAEEAAAASAARGRAWTDIATDFFGLAAEIDRDTRRLFTASAAPTNNAAAAEDARRLRRGLDKAARYLEELERTRP